MRVLLLDATLEIEHRPHACGLTCTANRRRPCASTVPRLAQDSIQPPRRSSPPFCTARHTCAKVGHRHGTEVAGGGGGTRLWRSRRGKDSHRPAEPKYGRPGGRGPRLSTIDSGLEINIWSLIWFDSNVRNRDTSAHSQKRPCDHLTGPGTDNAASPSPLVIALGVSRWARDCSQPKFGLCVLGLYILY